MRAHKIALSIALTLAACDQTGSDCDAAEAAVDPIGPELFLVEYVNEPISVALHRDANQIQLIERTRDQLTREVRATLSPAVLDAIEQAEDALADGEPLGNFEGECLTFFDIPNSRLTLGVLQAWLRFGYPMSCPPSALAPLDELLRDLIVALPSCEPTPLVSDCEVIRE